MKLFIFDVNLALEVFYFELEVVDLCFLVTFWLLHFVLVFYLVLLYLLCMFLVGLCKFFL
jgi:hypothetical protein